MKNKRGGKRTGSGRKPLSEEKTKTYSIALPESQHTAYCKQFGATGRAMIRKFISDSICISEIHF